MCREIDPNKTACNRERKTWKLTWIFSLSFGCNRKWTSLREFTLFLLLNSNTLSNSNLATTDLGNPKFPVPIAGKVIDFKHSSSAVCRHSVMMLPKTCKAQLVFSVTERHFFQNMQFSTLPFCYLLVLNCSDYIHQKECIRQQGISYTARKKYNPNSIISLISKERLH